MKQINIYHKLSYQDDKPAISVLYETETSKEIRILFRKGQQMQQHQTPYPISVYIVEGTLDFGVANQVYHLEKGSLVSLEGNVPHDLKAQSDCIVRLSLTHQDSSQRVKNVIQ